MSGGLGWSSRTVGLEGTKEVLNLFEERRTTLLEFVWFLELLLDSVNSNFFSKHYLRTIWRDMSLAKDLDVSMAAMF